MQFFVSCWLCQLIGVDSVAFLLISHFYVLFDSLWIRGNIFSYIAYEESEEKRTYKPIQHEAEYIRSLLYVVDFTKIRTLILLETILSN